MKYLIGLLCLLLAITSYAAPVTIIAAGDIAPASQNVELEDGSRGHSVELTAQRVEAILANNPDAIVFALGDNAYGDGSTTQFATQYDPTWGRFWDKTFPMAGNHDWHQTNAQDYLDYFCPSASNCRFPGDTQVYRYTLDLGSNWHIIVIDTEDIQQHVKYTAAQWETWIHDALEATDRECIMIMGHHHRFTSREGRGTRASLQRMWELGEEFGADIYLAGHNHQYERFAKQTAAGVASATGMRQFTSGGGGAQLSGFNNPPAANSEVRIKTHGVLKLTLKDTSYDWQFIDYLGNVRDSGSEVCATSVPPVDEKPTITLDDPADGDTVSGASVSLAATASDAEGMDRVDFYVNGELVATDTSSPYTGSWDSLSVADDDYQVWAIAVDTSQQQSMSDVITVTVSNGGSADTTAPTTFDLHTVALTSATQYDLSWDASSDAGSGLSHYAVYRCQGTSCTPSTLLKGNISTAITTYSDTSANNLVRGYKVVAYDNAGNSRDSDTEYGGPLPSNTPPDNVSITPSVSSGTVPLTVNFTGSANDGDSDTLTYTWDFGDMESGTGATPSHTFDEVGTYTVTLTVTDGKGGIASETTEITVNPDTTGTITYTEDTSEIANPERGLMDRADLSLYDTLDTSKIDAYGSYGTLVWVTAHLDTYRDWTDDVGVDVTNYVEIPMDTRAVDVLQDIFDEAHTEDLKVVLRFVYNGESGIGSTTDPDAAEPDAPIEVALRHIDQLMPIVKANKHLLAVMQAGFVGHWGEWHSSKYLHEQRQRITDALLAHLPDDRVLQVRYPRYKELFYGGPLFSGTANTLLPRARVGHHNDCFLCNDSDSNTYRSDSAQSPDIRSSYCDTAASEVECWEDFVAQDNKWLPFGGELSKIYPPKTDCDVIIDNMEKFGVDFLNGDFNTAVHTELNSQGCWTEIKTRLGYRFVLDSAVLASTATIDRAYDVEINFHNDGFGKIYNPRPVYLVLDNATYRHNILLDVDPRTWLAGRSHTIQKSITIPPDVVAGTYNLHLWLPDADSSLQSDPLYSVRFSNSSTWDATDGYNTLLSSITVSAATDITPPLPIPVLSVQYISSSECDLTWTQATDRESGFAEYEVYRCQPSGSPLECTPTTKVKDAHSTESWNDTSTGGVNRRYMVKAINNDAMEVDSNQVNCLIP